MQVSTEIVPSDVRHSAITSQSIGVPELEILLEAVRRDAEPSEYDTAIVEENVLGLKTTTSREWRIQTLRRLYLLDRNELLFRALLDLWNGERDARPLLACLCALARDTIFRSTAEFVLGLAIGERVSAADLSEPIERQFPGSYKQRTIATIAKKAYASWGQTGHLSQPGGGARVRIQAICRPANVAYALMLGHLKGARGEALFETLWAQVLDHPKSQLYDLAQIASRHGMIEFRKAGGIVEVGFRELLRPMEGKLL